MIAPDDLDARAIRGDTLMIETFPYVPSMTMPALHGGWAVSYTGKKKPDSVGSIYLIPRHPWTRSRWEIGQKKKAEEKGLTETQAGIWVKSRVRYKHRLLERLCEMINDIELCEGYSKYKRDFTNDEYQCWSARTGIRDGLSPAMRGALIKLFGEVTGTALIADDETGDLLEKDNVEQSA